MGHGLTGPQPAHDVEEFVAARVALLLVEVITERALLVGLAADDDVEQDPARRVLGKRRGHLRRQRRAHQAGTEGHEERQRRGLARQQRGGDEGVLTPGARGDQCTGETESLGRPDDRREVVDAGLAIAAGGAEGCAVATPDDEPAVAVGGQEPVQ